MRVRLLEIECRERPYRLRMPFRFGVTTATHGRQAIVRAQILLENGKEATGWSAEALGAKWFDKNTALTDAQNHHQLRRSIEIATGIYLQQPFATPFDLFAAAYSNQVTHCAAEDLNPLIASYGQSLVDRAILDGFCRALGVSFDRALRGQMVGLGATDLTPELASFDFARLFDGHAPASQIAVRHTVGLADPILSSEIAPGDRVNDGLPQSLEEVIGFYGNRYFKLKICGDPVADIERLERIASVLDRAEKPYVTTLDGNEQYSQAEAIAELFSKLLTRPSLKRLAGSIMLVEQPVHRAKALSASIKPLASRIPVIIDESDGELSAFSTARELGYTGVSSKACKGVWKSILNLARCKHWNSEGQGGYFMSAEDLTCEPGISIQQDLALVRLLGLTHVERNAHHFIDGFGDRPEAEARAFLAAHPDLYHLQDGRVRLHIENGNFQIGSLDVAGFGAAIDPAFDAAEPMPRAAWPQVARVPA